MNVLIVRPDGIGDVVLSLPVASQLRQLIAGVKIGFLTSPVAAPILDRHPDVDYVRTVRWEDPLAKMRRAFSDGVDVAIFLKPFRRLMWAAFLARVPVRVATGYRWYSLLANRRVYETKRKIGGESYRFLESLCIRAEFRRVVGGRSTTGTWRSRWRGKDVASH
jgi:ADP-heptose:LPS heptosyltransferase